MNTFNRNVAYLLITLTLLLSGCANTGSSLLSGTKPDPRLTSGEQAQFFSSSGAQSCGVGAATGAAVGALTGALMGDGKKALAGAAIGGAAGCTVGITANYYLDNLKKNYATTSDRLQAMDTDINKNTADVDKSTIVMEQVISDNQATLTQISIQKDKAEFDHATAKSQLAQIDANINTMKNKIKNMEDIASGYKVALQGQKATTSAEKSKLANLNKEYANLNNKIANLEKETNELFEQRQAIALG